MKKSTTKTKTVESPVTLKFSVNGVVTETKVDNVLHALRDLKVDGYVKTLGILEFRNADKVFSKRLKIIQLKKIIASDMNRMFLAKVVNTQLGLTGENLYV